MIEFLLWECQPVGPTEVYLQGSTIRQLPAHLKCMMLPPGILMEEQLGKVVQLVLEFQDVFVSPAGKVGFTDWVKHEIDAEVQSL